MRAGNEAGVETVGQRLRRLRQESGLSQRDLASPGVSYAYISRIEAGARRPSVKALRQLAPKLGVSVEYLETGRDLSDRDQRELRLSEAELTLRLEQDSPEAEAEFAALLAEAQAAGDAAATSQLRSKSSSRRAPPACSHRSHTPTSTRRLPAPTRLRASRGGRSSCSRTASPRCRLRRQRT